MATAQERDRERAGQLPPRETAALPRTETDAPAPHMPPVPSIALSWQRCAEAGVRRDQPAPLPASADLPAPDATALARTLALARPAMEDVYQFIEGSRSAIGFVDAEARLLDLVGDPDSVSALAALGWTTGSCWSEQCACAHGGARALLESFPAQVCGGGHYWAFLAPYCARAPPVHDSLGGVV